MAKFDVYPDDSGYLLDCQADVFETLNTRFVVPLRPVNDVVQVDRRLNPVLIFGEERWVMQTHMSAAVPRRELRGVAGSLIEHEYEIGAALDMLISGY